MGIAQIVLGVIHSRNSVSISVKKSVDPIFVVYNQMVNEYREGPFHQQLSVSKCLFTYLIG